MSINIEPQTPNDDFRKDELINIKLPREQYELLKAMIEREQAYTWLTNTLKNNWIWLVGSGILTIWLLYDKVHLLWTAKG